MSPVTRRRFRLGLLAMLLLAAAAWIVPSYFSAERYRRGLEAGLERALHRPVKFASVSFRLLPRPGFSIENAEILEDPAFGSEPFARVDRIECDLRWRSLWHSRKDFARLLLERPSFNLVLSPEGEWNVGRLLRQSGVAAPKRAALGAATTAREPLDLAVEDGRVNFKVGANKIPFALTEARANLHFDPAAGQMEFRVVSSPMRPDLAMPTPGPVEVEGRWTPGADLLGPLDATLRLRGALLYDWIPLLSGTNSGVYGVIDSDIHLTGTVLKLTAEGESRLTQLQRWGEPASSEPLPCAFRFRSQLLGDRQRLVVENFEASFLDSHLHVSGTIDRLRSSPQLDLVVALERSRLEDAQTVLARLWPHPGAWSVKGRVDGMLTLQGPWAARKYGGFVGARQVSVVTPAGSFPVSELAVRITNRGALLAPARITFAPRLVVTAEGEIQRGYGPSHYALQLGAKGLRLGDVVAFARGLGVPALQGFDAEGTATVAAHFTGSAWPWTRPEMTAHGAVRLARLLIPGLTEPVKVPRANFEFTGDQLTIDPLLVGLGGTVFTASLVHRGARHQPWQFAARANALNLEQGALWFDALGHRRPLPLLERLPGLATFRARRSAASQLFGSLNAQGDFSTAHLSYRGIDLQDFKGRIEVSDRTVHVRHAAFRVAGARGEATGLADFTIPPVKLFAEVALTGLRAESFTSRWSAAMRDVRGAMSAKAQFETQGFAREELAANLTGEAILKARELTLGDFDPVRAIAQIENLGALEPVHGPVAVHAVTFELGVAKRQVTLKNGSLEMGGAAFQLAGTYPLGGPLNLEVRADLRRTRRHWLAREDPPKSGSLSPVVHLSGPLDQPAVLAPVEASRGRE